MYQASAGQMIFELSSPRCIARAFPLVECVPELPEVETLRATLETIQGVEINNVTFGAYTGCLANSDPNAFRSRIVGHRLESTGRRGKYLLLGLSSSNTIAVHLRMTGELLIVAAATPQSRHHHLTLVLDHGRELRYQDVRKFGRLWLLDKDGLAELDRALGPEPLASELTSNTFASLLAGRRRAIKPLLLDQTFIAGIGNIYADEALFLAGIHPLRPAASLTDTESARLLDAIREVLSGAIARHGTTIRSYRSGFGEPGTNQHYLRIYQRQAGDPCPVCGQSVVRLVIAQRGTKLCPSCQREGTLLPRVSATLSP